MARSDICGRKRTYRSSEAAWNHLRSTRESEYSEKPETFGILVIVLAFRNSGKMARRSGNRYFVEIADGARWKLPAYLWRYYAEKRLIEPFSRFGAKLRDGVMAIIEKGELILRDCSVRVGVPIPSSWRWIERARWSYMNDDALRRAVQEMCAPQGVKNEIRLRADLGRFVFGWAEQLVHRAAA